MSKGADSTQLCTKFGFQDPDRQNHKHNYASSYIVENIEPIVRTIYNPETFLESHDTHYECPCGEWKLGNVTNVTWDSIKIFEWKPEAPICKGSGQYQTTVGFMDLAASAICHIKYDLECICLVQGWKKEKIKYSEAIKIGTKNHPINKCARVYDVKSIRKIEKPLDEIINVYVSHDTAYMLNMCETPSKKMKPKNNNVQEEVTVALAKQLHNRRKINRDENGYFISDYEFNEMITKTPTDDDLVEFNVAYIALKKETHTKSVIVYLPCEVKIAPVGIETIQLQLNFYTQTMQSVLEKWRYYLKTPFLVFTEFDLSEQDVKLLGKSNAVWIRLGEKFNEWYNNIITTSAKPRLVI